MSFDFKRIRGIMNAHRWTDSQLAMELRMDADRVTRLLSGRATPRPGEMERMLRYIGIEDIEEVRITVFVA